MTRATAIYDASNVATFAFGGGICRGGQSFALGFEVAVRYASAPSRPNSTGLPTVPPGPPRSHRPPAPARAGRCRLASYSSSESRPHDHRADDAGKDRGAENADLGRVE